jgi:hypothetical protein
MRAKDMVHYSASHQEIRDYFNQLNIPTDNPGFYDHPNFLTVEHEYPFFLANYARFVSTLPLDDSYIKIAYTKIPVVVEELYIHLFKENPVGRCVDISGILLRILEKLNIWSFAVKGSLTIDFPTASNVDRTYFWSVDEGNFFAGHAWICAPPYDVIDLSIRYQPYSENEADFLPKYLMEENMAHAKSDTYDIISPKVRDSFLSCGVPLSCQLEQINPETPKFINVFPAKAITINGTTLKYTPVAGFANDAPLEAITNMKFQGKFPLQLYEDNILPKLNQ